MNLQLSDTQKIMLLRAAKGNGVISMSDAREMYSSKSSAKSSIQKLETMDFITRINEGHWRVEKAVDDVRSSLTLTNQQEILLLKAVENNGRLSKSLADSMFASESSAKSALRVMKHMGFIENTAPGFWKVKKVTHDVKKQYKEQN